MNPGKTDNMEAAQRNSLSHRTIRWTLPALQWPQGLAGGPIAGKVALAFCCGNSDGTV